jgi:putative two-component system response regulator
MRIVPTTPISGDTIWYGACYAGQTVGAQAEKGAPVLIHIVDDSASNLVTIGQLVRQACGDADIALLKDPLESLARCRDAMPDLIVVDYMMPGIDGIQYIEEFRGIAGSGRVPILMVTASTDPEIQARARQAGATDFLTKPIRHDGMRGRLTTLLSRQTSREE